MGVDVVFESLERFVGGQILAREMHDGKVWAARPLRLLAVEDDLLVAHLPHGSAWLRPVKPDGAVHRIPREPWKLALSRWAYDTIVFVPAGEPFAIHTMRMHATDGLRGWYINAQEPARVTSDGFDYLDHTLDVIVEPGLETWQLKDEDELALGRDEGLYDDDAVVRIRDAAEAGLTFLRRHHEGLRRWSDTYPNFRPLDLPDGMGVDR